MIQDIINKVFGKNPDNLKQILEFTGKAIGYHFMVRSATKVIKQDNDIKFIVFDKTLVSELTPENSLADICHIMGYQPSNIYDIDETDTKIQFKIKL